jgi:hypothetical protein
MNPKSRADSAVRWLLGGIGLAAVPYVACVGAAWWRYGRVPPASGDDHDPLLDRFMPTYDVVERHYVRVAAPAEITFAASREMDLLGSPIVRAVFKVRQLVLGGTRDEIQRPRGMLAEVLSLGWGILDEVTGREVVVGAVTKPWEADVTFRALPAADFAAFQEPGYVKIAWTLRADPITARESVFRTETRAIATDPASRARFRQYWAFASPGIALIRRLSLAPLKKAAERRAREVMLERHAGELVKSL